MHQEGHWGAALLVYAPLGFVVALVGAIRVALVAGIVAVALAMVPDQDQRVPGLDHRGLTHTVWFALLVGAILGVAGGLLGTANSLVAGVGFAGLGFLVGALTVVSHIGADALTPMGVEPLAPVDDRHLTFDVTRASNPAANYALLALGALVSGGALWLATAVRNLL